jgi:hypothetical protein
MHSHRAVVFSLEVPISIRGAAFGHPDSFVVFISLAYKPVESSLSSSFDRRIRTRSPSLIHHFGYVLGRAPDVKNSARALDMTRSSVKFNMRLSFNVRKYPSLPNLCGLTMRKLPGRSTGVGASEVLSEI